MAMVGNPLLPPKQPTTMTTTTTTATDVPLLSSSTIASSNSKKPPLVSPTSLSRSNSANNNNNNKHHDGNRSISSRNTASKATPPLPPYDPDEPEQALFEQRLCEDIYGVAIRKINHHGKSNLRYIRCFWMDMNEWQDHQAAAAASSTRSVSSKLSRGAFSLRGLRSSLRSSTTAAASSRSVVVVEDSLRHKDALLWNSQLAGGENASTKKVLVWGKKKDVRVACDQFVAVKKGKTTDRTLKHPAPASRLLSLLYKSETGGGSPSATTYSLDIEAPTKVDRDKFARAFARFLNVPCEAEPTISTVARVGSTANLSQHSSRSLRSDDMMFAPSSAASSPKQQLATAPTPVSTKGGTHNNSNNAPLPVVMTSHDEQNPHVQLAWETPPPKASGSPLSKDQSPKQQEEQQDEDDEEDDDDVSSLTGAGYDPEIVEELHTALTTLKAELEEARAEAARAVKVAEQAITSAEQSNAKDWNATVTHKAAEAAALAQKRSAQAMAKQRWAEEQWDVEKRKCHYWREQAQTAQAEAGELQTRAAAAEVQRALLQQELEAMQQHPKSGDSNLEDASFGMDKDKMIGRHKNGLMDRIMTFESQSSNNKSPSRPSSRSGDNVVVLRQKLAAETAARRKLLHQLQDLKGNVRVYCRPLIRKQTTKGASSVTISSREILLLHTDAATPSTPSSKKNAPLAGMKIRGFPQAFEFDGILDSHDQREVFHELEAICLSFLDGYNLCVMTYGTAAAGTRLTLLGQVDSKGPPDNAIAISNFGIQLQSIQQVFRIIQQRKDKFEDVVHMSLVQVQEERLLDLLATTAVGQARGKPIVSEKSKRRNKATAEASTETPPATKLEIKTNANGETIVHGSLGVQVSSLEDVIQVWQQALQGRLDSTDSGDCHWIATFTLESKNIATGVGCRGKIQFVELASADVVTVPPAASENTSPANSKKEPIATPTKPTYKVIHKSLETLHKVVQAKSQYLRNIPYRNSTLTHLLSDNLDADTKVVVVACVTDDPAHLPATTGTLQFASELKKLVIGKATRHSLVSDV